MQSFTKFLVPPLTVLTATISLVGTGWAHDSVVNVSLWDKGGDAGMATGLGMGMGGDMSKATMGIKLSTNVVEAGKVTFEVANSSKDNIHEMVIAPITKDQAPLPYIASESEVDEDNIGDLGEVSELDPGKDGSLTLNLKPGKYVLFCNVAGHYMNGMWALLTVN
jgi:uncharacterized cupredoxin-like copper-binding protein